MKIDEKLLLKKDSFWINPTKGHIWCFYSQMYVSNLGLCVSCDDYLFISDCRNKLGLGPSGSWNEDTLDEIYKCKQQYIVINGGI